MVPAGHGDGETRRPSGRCPTDGFDGFFSLEPHLQSAGALGGFSGPDNFRRATHAFTTILDTEGITHR